LQQALTQRLTGDASQPVVTRPSENELGGGQSSEGPDVAEDATGEPV